MRNNHTHDHRRGSALSFNRNAWSSLNSDFNRMPGAFGDAHAKAWPGASSPALAQLVSDAAAGCRSTRVTSWPSRAR